jgi:hypothetical protein
MARKTDGRSTWMAIGLLAIAAIGIGLLARGLYPADLPESRDPDFVDNVFDNRAVLLAARLLLVSAAGVLAFGGLFIVVSIGNRMKDGEWLRRAGPFEIAEEPIGRAEGEVDLWRRIILASDEETANLQDRLRESEEIIEELRSG